jgi:hypothetical protein
MVCPAAGLIECDGMKGLQRAAADAVNSSKKEATLGFLAAAESREITLEIESAA